MDMEAGCFEIRSKLDFVLHFLPMEYLWSTVIPATNNIAAKNKAATWANLDHNEFLHFLGILLSMEVVDIHVPRHLYWANENGMFPNMNYGKIMSRNQFEDIIKYLQLSHNKDSDQQITDFLHAVNTRFRNATHPGTYLTLNESMIKSYHRNLKGKIKIIRKPRPIGSDIKNMCDGMSQILINLELYEGKDICLGRIMFVNMGLQQLRHCVSLSHTMDLADVLLLIVGSAQWNVLLNWWDEVYIALC